MCIFMGFSVDVVFQIISDSSRSVSSLLPLTPDHFGCVVLNRKRNWIGGSVKKTHTHADTHTHTSIYPFRKALSQVRAFVKGTSFSKYTYTHTHRHARIHTMNRGISGDCSGNRQWCVSFVERTRDDTRLFERLKYFVIVDKLCRIYS